MMVLYLKSNKITGVAGGASPYFQIMPCIYMVFVSDHSLFINFKFLVYDKHQKRNQCPQGRY